jgi:hypothetical protein
MYHVRLLGAARAFKRLDVSNRAGSGAAGHRLTDLDLKISQAAAQL